MAFQYYAYDVVKTVLGIFIEVAFFWQLRIYAWWTRKPPQEALASSLREAHLYEEWEAAAFLLDELQGNDLWRQNPTSKFYDYRLIYQRLQAIIEAREDEDVLGLVNLLRSGLVRNLGNITSSNLYNRANAGTKLLIEDYITQVALAVGHVATLPTNPSSANGLTSQAKLDLLHDTRQAFGRSALVLQGGAIFGLCHIGVVKALHLRGLLPRIIAGSDTGALIAALVGIHTEDELLDFLTGDQIDLSAFSSERKKPGRDGNLTPRGTKGGWYSTLVRRFKCLVRDGYFLDVSVLEECVRANVGDMTFEEAYARTKRVLNITVQSNRSGQEDIPSLLNYITAPNVLIWSAATASNAGSSPLYSPVTLLSKTVTGAIVPWSSRPSSPHQSRRSSTHQNQNLSTHSRPATVHYHQHTATHTSTPLSRIAELFNVNHFIVSQARPSIAPFLQPPTASTSSAISTNSWQLPLFPSTIWSPLSRLLVLEVQHRLRQLLTLGILPPSISRFLLDDTIPGASLTLMPELSAADFVGLLERPTARGVDKWILRGEKSVWPAVSAMKIRCTVEFELDRAYQVVRRRKPMDALAIANASPTTDKDIKPTECGQKSKTQTAGLHGDGRTDEHEIVSPPVQLGSQGEIWGQGQLRGNGEKRRQKRMSSGSEQRE